METVCILRRLQRAGNGGTPVSEKIQKITPEWQTEQNCSVDSAVARVKGKHHDGDVLSWMAYYAVKSGGTANLFVLCGWKGFSYIYKRYRSGKLALKLRTIIFTKDKKRIGEVHERKTKPKTFSLLRRKSNVQQSP